MKKIVSIILLSFIYFFSSNAMALNCVGAGSIVSDSVTLDKMVYLSNASNGDIIWRSDVYTRNITCDSKISEAVYIYAFPNMASEALPINVEMGLIFDGTDLGTMSSTGAVNSRRTDTGWLVKANVNLVKNNVTFQTYLKKTGDINTSSVTTITLFQLDGVGGLNTTPNAKNYKFNISGWDNVGTIDCRETVTNSSFSVSAVTDQALAGTASSQIDNPKVSVTCTGDSSTLNLTKSVSGKLGLSGTGSSFLTNKEGLSLNIFYEGGELKPNDSVLVTIPIASGHGNKVFNFDVKPILSVLELENPGWIFSNSDEVINSAIPFSFTPTLVSVN